MRYMNWSWSDLQELPARMYPTLVEEINREAQRIRDR